MEQTMLYPTWKEMLAGRQNGPSHQSLIETDGFKAVLVGLQAGEKIPPHPAAAAIYHFLEGCGWMYVDGERLAVEQGQTLVVPAGILRGVEAKTKLAFLGSHGASQNENRWPPMKMGLPILVGAMLMFGLMIGWMILPAQMMSRIAELGLGMWGVMLIPLVGMVAMLIMMLFVYRRMTGIRGAAAQMLGHRHIHAEPSQVAGDASTTLEFNILSVSCSHCRMTIERAVGEIRGVASVSVDVEAKRATVQFNSPATRADIEAVLEEIGHPPSR